MWKWIKTYWVVSLAVILVALGFIILIIYFFNLPPENWKGSFIDTVVSSQIGEFIGGMVGSLWALAGVILLFYNLSLQRKQIEKQNEQQAESTFYKLLDYHKEAVLNPDIEKINTLYEHIKKSIKDYKRVLSSKKFNPDTAPYYPLFYLKKNSETINQLCDSISHMIFYIEKSFSEKEFYQTTLFQLLTPAEKYLFGMACNFDTCGKSKEIKQLSFDYLKYYKESEYFYQLSEGKIPSADIEIMDYGDWNVLLGEEDKFCKIRLRNNEKNTNIKVIESKWKILTENEERIITHNKILKPNQELIINLFQLYDYFLGDILDSKKNILPNAQNVNKWVEFLIIIEFEGTKYELQWNSKMRINTYHFNMPNKEHRLSFSASV